MNTLSQAATANQRWTRNPAVMSSDISGEFVLMDVPAGQYYNLDRVASAIWRQLQTPLSSEQLCSALCAEFDGDPAVIRTETQSFLKQLADSGLVISS